MPKRILSKSGGECLTACYDIDLLTEDLVERIPACFTHARIMRLGYDNAAPRKSG
jgi:hypothetical protein